MGTQNHTPETNERLASQDSYSQSASADQHLCCFDQECPSNRIQPPDVCLTDPAEDSGHVDGFGLGNDSFPLPQDKNDDPRVAEPLPSNPQPTHYEQQWPVASYSSPNFPHKQLHTQVAPIPSPTPFNYDSEQEPVAPSLSTAPSHTTPPSHSQLLKLAAAPTAASVAPVPATTRPPLQVPYPDKLLQKQARPQEIAAVIERAARGIDSCSNYYGEADRGDNKLCTVCYGRQKGKNQRHKAKQRARKAREAAEAIFRGLGIAFDSASQPQVVASEPAVESPGVATPPVEAPDVETPDIPAATT
ncbi:hypothetical protein QR685DRAFT_550845 [Neurospora intermedia]|uniref:Uncharacterized protein n=1 Tax=Neurospora intermedia TaxID=5142 RepID=A0ABR3DJK6_NEUIN